MIGSRVLGIKFVQIIPTNNLQFYNCFVYNFRKLSLQALLTMDLRLQFYKFFLTNSYLLGQKMLD